MKMFYLPLNVFVFVNLFFYAECSIPIEKLCVNHLCKEPISKARGSIKYVPPSKHMLSFDRGQEMTIISKSKNVEDYWEADINGKIGYVPSSLIKEVRVFHEISNLIPVPVLIKEENESKEKESNSTLSQTPAKDKITSSEAPPPVVQKQADLNIKPAENINSPSQIFNVIEGTTIYEDIIPSSTVDMKSTAQTATVTVPEDEIAAVPPEVIKLNENYKGQLDMKDKINIVFEKNDEDVKVESKNLDKEEEENDFEVEEGEEDDDDEEDEDEGEGEESDDDEGKALNTEENLKYETKTVSQPKIQELEDKTQEANTIIVEKVTSQTSASVKAEEVTVTPYLQEETLQTSPDLPSQWNLLNNFKATPPSVETNVVLQDPNKNNVTPLMPQAVEVVVNHSQDTTTEAVNMHHPRAQDAYTQLSSSPTQPVPQDFTLGQYTSAQTPPSALAQSTIFNQFTASADTPPENTYQLEPKIEKITTDTVPVPETFNQIKSLSHTTPVNQKMASAVEVTTDTSATSSQPVTPDPSTLNHLSDSTDIPPVEQPVSEQPALEITQKKMEVETLVVSEVTDASKSTEIQEIDVIEPKTIETVPTQSVINEKEDIKEKTTILPEGNKESSFLPVIMEKFSSWYTPTPKDQLPDEVFWDTQNLENSFGKESLVDDAKSGSCENGLGFDCKDLKVEQQSSIWISWIPTELVVGSIKTSNQTFLYLVVTAVTVLLFTLGHSFIEKRGKTGPLIAKINKLEQELLVASKEWLLLKDEIQSAREKITLYENSANDELVLSLQAELEESKRVKAELEQNIEILQQELDAATEAGLDLNKMLSEVLTQKGGSETLLKSVENLQSQLDRQQRVIDEMTKKLGVKNQENEALQSALEAANEKSENLEVQLNEIKHNFNLHLKEKENLTQDLNSQITQLKTRINQLGQTKEKEMMKLKKDCEEIQKKFTETTGALTVKEEEVKSLKEAIKKLKTKQDLKLDAVFDVCKVNGELAKEKKENQILAEKLQKEEADKKALVERVKLLDMEVQKLKNVYNEAELKKDEAEKKLEVLSAYFKEKETQLQKELGLQEALWVQKKGDENTVYNMIKSLQEEVESYKSQNETLKKEIVDQERGLKNQMAALEQKAHENWVTARQTERKLEEAKQEMAQLRNRLTLAEKNSNSAEGKSGFRSSEELNGVEAASPILHDTPSPLLFPLPLDPGNSNLLPPGFMPPPMFMPPPIGGFMPPPPFLPGDRRPPPLGRMSSPPLNNRFSPSSPADYPFEMTSPPSLSPSAATCRSPNEDRDRYRHRSPPYPPPPLHSRNWDDSNEMPGFIPISSQTDPRRDHKDSNISSEHSSSDSLDKSSRHSGRV